MYELILKNISRYIQLTKEETEYFTSLLKEKKLRRKQYLLQEGDICRHENFVVQGCLRTYHIDSKGQEHIVQFAVEDWWIGDMYSSLTGEPAEYNIDAIEDTEALLLTNESHEKLLHEAPVFERFFRLLMQNRFIAMQRRLRGNIVDTAEEKYKNFIRLYPNIAQRVPQHNIASYLGITPESLSRIRKQMAER